MISLENIGQVPAIQNTLHFLNRLGHNLLPHLCPLCRNHSISYVCDECFSKLSLIKHTCFHCSLPLNGGGTICGECVDQLPKFTKAICAFEYSPAFSVLLTRFKDAGDFHAIKQACNSLASKITREYRDKNMPDLLVPVPLHWRKRWQRGFNQSEIVSRELASTLGLPKSKALIKNRITTTQKTLSKKERQKNLSGSFSVIKSEVFDKHIAIVDDVITTGSTGNVIAEICFRAGARQVDIWALARTPKS